MLESIRLPLKCLRLMVVSFKINIALTLKKLFLHRRIIKQQIRLKMIWGKSVHFYRFCFNTNTHHMKKITCLLFALLTVATGLKAQKTTYNIPKNIESDKLSISFQKVSVSSSSYYINFKTNNKGNGLLLFDRSLVNIEQNNGQINATSDQYQIKTGDSKTVYCQFRIKPPVTSNAEKFALNLKGISYALPAQPLKADNLLLKESMTKDMGPFSFKLMEYKVYSDRIYANVKCTYKGDTKTLGKIDLTKISVTGGKAEVVKKGDHLLPGKSYSFSINITPDGEETAIVFNDALQVMTINEINIDPVVITSTTYKEPAPETEKAAEQVKVTEQKAAKQVLELSYTDFSTLKKDIETEMNNGGKPIEMANEFLMEKKHISTVQVIDIMSVFSLDGSKLKFAKMAYPFTSDKQKFHLVVPKLAYVKNKQALEEFLEQQ